MQGVALPQASLIKGRFGGFVYIVEDISPPPATIKKGGRLKSDFWSVSLFLFAIDAKSDYNTNV